MNQSNQQADHKAGGSRLCGAMPPLACYANYFEVGHNAFEFLLDVGQVEPQSGDVRFTNRVAISPVHAKLLSAMLSAAVAQFEATHHPIPDMSDDEAELSDVAFLEEFERRALDVRRAAAVGMIAAQPSAKFQEPVCDQTTSLEQIFSLER